jgi:hypothetical protein
MNRFVKTALAIAVAGPAAHAGTGDSEWAALDSEISGLASSLQPSQGDGMGWSAMLRAVYAHSSDDIATGPPGGTGGADVSGFNFKDVDLAFWGNSGSFMWRVSADIDDNESGIANGNNDLKLEDAYVRWNCGGYFDTQMGQFKPNILSSGNVDPENLLFINRTVLGSSADFWENGIGASGTFEQFGWSVALLNGLDGHERDHAYVVRLMWLLGQGAGMYEGAMGSSDVLNATLGLSWIHDDSFSTGVAGGADDTEAYILDFNGSISNFGFGAEIADLGDTFAGATDEDYSNLAVPLILNPESTPWALTGSYLINPEWEVAVRYEDLDNDDTAVGPGDDNTVLSVGANWHRDGGKWQIQWSDIDGDTLDGSVIEVGYAIGKSR